MADDSGLQKLSIVLYNILTAEQAIVKVRSGNDETA